MEETPGHGSDFVKELDRLGDLRLGEGSSPNEETKVGIDLSGRGVCDAPVVQSISPGSRVTFREVRRYGRRRLNDLIGEALERSRNAHHERDGDAGGFEGLAVGDEAGCRKRTEHDHLLVVHASPPSR